MIMSDSISGLHPFLNRKESLIFVTKNTNSSTEKTKIHIINYSSYSILQQLTDSWCYDIATAAYHYSSIKSIPHLSIGLDTISKLNGLRFKPNQAAMQRSGTTKFEKIVSIHTLVYFKKFYRIHKVNSLTMSLLFYLNIFDRSQNQ